MVDKIEKYLLKKFRIFLSLILESTFNIMSCRECLVSYPLIYD